MQMIEPALHLVPYILVEEVQDADPCGEKEDCLNDLEKGNDAQEWVRIDFFAHTT